MSYKILLVDDEINSLKVLSAALSGKDKVVETARSGEEALELCKSTHYDLVISDYKMAGMNGEELLEKVKTMTPETPFILLTAFGTIELAVNAMRKGAYTYLTKPVKLNVMESVVNDVLFPRERDEDDETPGRHQFLNIIGKTKPMQEVFSLVRRVAKTDANILILGESGTGKELVARAVHYSSLRADKPFIPIDCTTIPSELMESELFGYEKGAFSGAGERKIGLIEMAHGGTVFLDEIGDLDYALEKKLLRFLQEREIRRVGGKESIMVDVRVISATNRDIEKDVDSGDFRTDLYYRLNVITINVPPLRERKDDISLLANYYLDHFCRKNKKKIHGIDREVFDILKQYDWQGNVRELENVMERAVILCPHDSINIECLPCKIRATGEEECLELNELNLPEMEKKIIRKALDKAAWNQSSAAVILGISRKQLRTKMKNLGLLQP
ncbi:MAG: sigma-54 dependent transcriptional regulator [Proteobacteria bacterium]|nr:sigma-54 dependent transcriptional regulator [Pseudomonadota bacterium]MBU1736923.1 sigma-54 dependent transcriptional regulator [Pseudomonadota bacterium]